MGDSLPAEEDSSPARGGLESACLGRKRTRKDPQLVALQEFPELLFKGDRLGAGDEPAARAVEHPQLAGLQEFPELLFKGGRRAGRESCSWGTRPAGTRVLLVGDSGPRASAGEGLERTPSWWGSRNFRNCSLRGEGVLGA